MSELNNTKWMVKTESETSILLKAYKFNIEGDSIVFKKSLGHTDIFINIASFPSSKTIVIKEEDD